MVGAGARLNSLSCTLGAHDPAAFVAVPVLLATVAFISVWLPARTACRVDPVVALRAE